MTPTKKFLFFKFGMPNEKCLSLIEAFPKISVTYVHGYGYSCLEKLTTEKCKQQAKQPEKKY